ncbi:hypothetical protein ALI44B_10990 [Leifsonia sp. ALI-44-B]|uniref:aggregation-promoting factor C-terminal-like domain-containing protein n=1 Tax=Leifsonia sp. ALI-44-B TaxID=1933776 RepID=UPI00097BD27E|nr:hypothetical protein [Leifsonia sp. ALI-44-B]ONI61874.1 hypothetical protein ALI44B_10990 [Leifsonia sp. ALI-44-B]
MGKHVAAQQVLVRPSGRTHQRFRRPVSRGRSVLSVFAFAAVGAVCVVNVVDPTAGAIASPYFQPAGRFDGESAQTVTATDGYETTFDRDGYEVVLAPKPVITAPPVDAAGAPGAGGPVIAPDPGSAKALAREMLAARGMGDDQFSCLVSLWNKESGWRVTAANPSGAYGIPQALPGRKMATVGADWQTNPVTQITWGLGYIAARYGSPCGAWAHSQAKNFY